MASAVIHICVAKKVNEKLKMNEHQLFLGTIAPDLSKQLGETKEKSHFLLPGVPNMPNLEQFLTKYKGELDDPFVMGYYIHLYTDYLWFSSFLQKLVDEQQVKLLDGGIGTFDEKQIEFLVYNDYSNINIDLIDHYGVSLELFYEWYMEPKTKIEEIPMDKLRTVIDKMGIIIENSKVGKDYIFDSQMVIDFIDETATEILRQLKK